MGLFQQAYEQQTGTGPKPQSGGVFQQAYQSQTGTLPKPDPFNTNQFNGGQQVKDSFNSGINQIKEGNDQTKTGFVGGLEGGVKEVAGGLNALFSPLAPLFGGVGQGVNAVADKVSDIPAVQKFAMSNAGKNTARGADDVSSLSTLAGAAAGATEVDPAAIAEGTKNVVSGAKDLITKSPEEKATMAKAQIQETISPKPTVKEARLAQSQGRLIQGKEPTLFKAGTEDTIAPSDKVIKATNTIQKNIPGAETMDESQLHGALDSKIKETATALKPEMQATPIKPESIQKINDNWSALKKQQIEEADATEEPNVRKQQIQFEARLMKSGNGTMNDLWETRKSYDDSVPENVKKANQLSPESLQNKKQIWLQNRGVITDAINDAETGMGAQSRQAFSDMHDMYNAKEGILSKAKLDKAKLSKFNQFLKDNPGTAKVLGGATAYEVLKHLGVPLP